MCMELRESQSCIFLHEYPKLMWDVDWHDKRGLFNFFENENEHFPSIWWLRNRQILLFFRSWLKRPPEVGFYFFT